MAAPLTSNFSGRHSSVESCSSTEKHPCRQGEIMTLTQRRCPYCAGGNVAAQRIYTIQCGAPRAMYQCAGCERAFSETSNTPLAHLKTPIALVVQVLTALTEGVGINAATRLYGVSKNSIYRWQARLSGLKKHYCCLP
jgi:transposase-like protein